MGGMGGMPGMAQQQQQQQGPTRKAEPVEYNFNVSLEDLFGGGEFLESCVCSETRGSPDDRG